jgi:hypothetical protein
MAAEANRHTGVGAQRRGQSFFQFFSSPALVPPCIGGRWDNAILRPVWTLLSISIWLSARFGAAADLAQRLGELETSRVRELFSRNPR